MDQQFIDIGNAALRLGITQEALRQLVADNRIRHKLVGGQPQFLREWLLDYEADPEDKRPRLKVDLYVGGRVVRYGPLIRTEMTPDELVPWIEMALSPRKPNSKPADPGRPPTDKKAD